MTVAEYSTPLDIVNRAAQHLGVRRITAADFASSTPSSKQASAFQFCYDKLRRAELQRNVWRFSVRRAVMRPIAAGTLEIVANAWSATTLYERGGVASFNGLTWVSHTTANLGVTPGTTNDWDVYFGPLTISPYDNATGYYLGENVYKSNGSGRLWVFSAVTDATQPSTGLSPDPSVPTAYDATIYYPRGDVIIYGGFLYRSNIEANINNVPGAYQMWNSKTVYIQGATIIGTDGNLYVNKVGGSNVNPVTDTTNASWLAVGWPAPWLPAFSGCGGGRGWIRQNCTVKNPVPVYPAGCGPAQQAWNRNVFRLPNGYLRRAPQDPKAGTFAYLGSPTALAPDDWVLEANLLTSQYGFPIPLRFAADITRVTEMDGLFCEALAARIAFETAEELTQAPEKISNASNMYRIFMADARIVNGIETGPTSPPEDEYLTCRA